jgi:hypothetical protein
VPKKRASKVLERAHRNDLNASQTDSAASSPVLDCAAYRLGRRSPGAPSPRPEAPDASIQ